jgi:hypothetical protein
MLATKGFSFQHHLPQRRFQILIHMCRLGKQCITFLIKNHLIEKPEDFFCASPPTDADMYIVAWIMNECVAYSFAKILISYCLMQM